MAEPVLLILGSGPKIGACLVEAFAAKGYKVALVSRSPRESATAAGHLHITANFEDPQVVEGVFAKVKEELGIPSVVIYNCATKTWTESASDPFGTVSADNMLRSLNVNTISPYAAAQQAVEGFKDRKSVV